MFRLRVGSGSVPDGGELHVPNLAASRLARAAFLGEDASCGQLLRAAADNHFRWFQQNALAGGGEVRRVNGVRCVYAPGMDGGMGEVILAFPRLRRADAGATLDAVLDYCRSRRPLRQVACWSMDAGRPRDLGARLVARGFDWGWRPRWMGLDFRRMRTDHPAPPGLQIAQEEDRAVLPVDDLPYYEPDGASRRQALTRLRPRRVWRFIAWRDGKPVGQTTLFLTTGRLGVAGIYDVGVVPAARRQGVGKAVVGAACRFAASLGCRHALLNATGETMYRQIGFEPLGWGQTWWLREASLDTETLTFPPPTPMQVAFTEAVGRGDVAALEALRRSGHAPHDLDANLPPRGVMTPMELTVMTHQPASAEWLVRQGAALDLLHAWDLGWKDRVRHLLAARPDLANVRRGDWQITPLHVAVERGDVDLARLLLTADPDLTITDAQFNSTALGWARHLQQAEIAALIEAQAATGPGL